MIATPVKDSKIVRDERPMTGKMLALVIALCLIAVVSILLVLLYPFSIHWAVVALVSVVAAYVLLVRLVGFFRKRIQSPLLSVALPALSFSIIGIIFYLVFPWGNIYPLASALGGAMASLVALSLYALWLLRFRPSNRITKMLNSGLGASIPVVLGYLIFGLLLLSPLNDFFMNRPGQAAPWPEQLSVAQREATRADKEVVLSWVNASPVNPKDPNYDTPLKSFFFFESPSGSEPSVLLHEIAPELTDQLYGQDDESYVQSETDFEALRKSVAAVQISASEALAKVRPEGLALAQERSVQLHPTSINLMLRGRSLAMDATIPDNLPAVWEVTLLGRNPYIVQAKYWVNATTGEIVKRDYGDLESASP